MILKNIPYETKVKIHDDYDKYTQYELCCKYDITVYLLQRIKEEIDNEKSKNHKGSW